MTKNDRDFGALDNARVLQRSDYILKFRATLNFGKRAAHPPNRIFVRRRCQHCCNVLRRVAPIDECFLRKPEHIAYNLSNSPPMDVPDKSALDICFERLKDTARSGIYVLCEIVEQACRFAMCGINDLQESCLLLAARAVNRGEYRQRSVQYLIDRFVTLDVSMDRRCEQFVNSFNNGFGSQRCHLFFYYRIKLSTVFTACVNVARAADRRTSNSEPRCGWT